MVANGLESLGQNGNAARKGVAKKTEDERALLDVTKPYDISYCCFDENFFNTGYRTISLENHFSAGDRDAEGIVIRMVMHPGGFVELVLESKLVANKVTTAILFKPKTVTPMVGKYRSQYAEKNDG